MENIYKECEINIFYFNSGNQPSSCGYCKKDGAKSKSSFSFGFSTDRLTPELYENLMFLGWRRCGDYVYRPNLEKSCCKLYSTRLDIERFKINKNQKRVMKNFRKFLIGNEIKKKTSTNLDENAQMTLSEEIIDKYELIIKHTIKDFISSKTFLEITSDNLIHLDFKVVPNKKTTLGDYSTNFLITTYHHLKRNTNDLSKFIDSNEFYKTAFESFVKYIENNVPNFSNSWKSTISEKTGHLNFFINEDKRQEMLDHHKIFDKKLVAQNVKNKCKEGQKIIEKDDEYKLELLNEIVNEPKISKKDLKHTYSIELEPNSNYSEEKFLIYKKYQIAIHKDKEEDLTPDRYINAWGKSNLSNAKTFVIKNSNNLIHPSQLGTWDLIHKIDGRIFAVGVLDILPTSVSSVYLYYDPEFSFLNPGVFTAIREIELVKEFNKHLDNNFKYYVMGFYCHNCPKMKYKGDYSPTEILCPVTLNFIDLEKVIPLVEANKFVKISENPTREQMALSKEQIKAILKTLILIYSGKNFNLVSFVRNYVSEHSNDILKNMENLLILVGKENLRYFKFFVS